MALDLNRWIEYAKARVTTAIGKSNDDLDRLEAEREAKLADKPWLASEGTAPTIDEAKARIEWEADEQRRRAEEVAGAGAEPPVGDAATDPKDPNDPTQPTTAPRDPIAEVLASPEGQQARVELEARQKEAAARLDEIRRELGVEGPPDPESPTS